MDYKRILWTSLLILAAGILLLCYPLPSLDFFVKLLGWLFLASSVLNIVMQFVRSRNTGDGHRGGGVSIISMLTAIASGALGLWMVLAPAGFATAMIYIIGAMMILGGLFLIFTMAVGFRPIRFPGGFYVLPALVAICGIVMCVLSPETTMSVIMTVTAVTMIVFAVGALIEVAGLISYRRNFEAPTSPTVPTESTGPTAIEAPAETTEETHENTEN